MNNVLIREKYSYGSYASDTGFDLQSSWGWVLALLFFFVIIGFLTKGKDKDHQENDRQEKHQHNDADKYSMEIHWSAEDNAYIVTIPELPGCRTHGRTYEEAVQRGKDAIKSWIEASQDWGDPIPPPGLLKAV